MQNIRSRQRKTKKHREGARLYLQCSRPAKTASEFLASPEKKTVFPWQEKLVAPLIATHLMENVQLKEKTDVRGKKLNYGLCA